MEIPRGALWLPGVGTTTSNEREAAKALHEYDPDLVLGQDKSTGQWVVCLRNGPYSSEPFPVLGLGFDLPDRAEIQRRLHQADTRRQGDKIVKAVMRRQEDAVNAQRHEAGEKTGVLAEHLEHGFRKQDAHPSPRVFLPAGISREG